VREFSPHVDFAATLGIATRARRAWRRARGTSRAVAEFVWPASVSAPRARSSPRWRADACRSAEHGKNLLGLGASEGKYAWNELTFDEPARKTWDSRVLVQRRVGIERTIYDVNKFRFYGGIGHVLNDDEFMCGGEDIDHCLNDHQEDGKGRSTSAWRSRARFWRCSAAPGFCYR
jgi:hypothetical protein